VLLSVFIFPAQQQVLERFIMPEKQIAKYTDLTVEQVKQLRNEIK